MLQTIKNPLSLEDKYLFDGTVINMKMDSK